MNTVRSQTGLVYTFYSFKGGVGRTMALANIAVLLAKAGHRVLAIDWDLEAPGLERFFAENDQRAKELRRCPGVVDLIRSVETSQLDWRRCVQTIRPGHNGYTLSFISAGDTTDDYTRNLQGMNLPVLFENHRLGAFIEKIRNEWLSEYDFVLVDSRTGLTDLGGICTVHLADVLVTLFTTTDSSALGVLDVVARARKAQEHFPMERRRLIAVPVPTRDESRTEYERTSQWRKTLSGLFAELYADWLPSGVTARDAIEILRIPYVPYWSFGEKLPVLEEGTTDPSSIGFAYDVLGRLLAERLDWKKALEGKTLVPVPEVKARTIDPAWLEKHRRVAIAGLGATGLTGRMEVSHSCVLPNENVPQSVLLSVARQAQINKFGWPIGVVIDQHEDKPRPVNDGIIAQVTGDHSFDYWTLNRSGDFYSLLTLPEDRHQPNTPSLFLTTRIYRVTEALLHAGNICRLLGADPESLVAFDLRHGGLKGRLLAPGSGTRTIHGKPRNELEDAVETTLEFHLRELEVSLAELVKRALDPLFVLFDFKEFKPEVYREIVTEFQNLP